MKKKKSFKYISIIISIFATLIGSIGLSSLTFKENGEEARAQVTSINTGETYINSNDSATLSMPNNKNIETIIALDGSFTITLPNGVARTTSSITYLQYSTSGHYPYLYFSNMNAGGYLVQLHFTRVNGQYKPVWEYRVNPSSSFVTLQEGEFSVQFTSTTSSGATGDKLTALQNFFYILSFYVNVRPIPTYTIEQGYYLFPPVETINSRAVDVSFGSNIATFLTFEQSINEQANPVEVERNLMAITSLHFANGKLWATGQELSTVVTTGTEFHPIFPILHLSSDFETTDQSVYQFLYQFYEIDEYYVDIFAEMLVPTARTLEEANEQLETAYQNGYNTGYDDGANASIIGDTTTGVISAIFSGLFGNIFKVEIFPNFPLYIFILIPVVFAVLGLILWLVRGK